MSEPKSFADARDFVIAQSGGECAVTMDTLEVFMQSCLTQMLDQISEDASQMASASLATTIDQGAYNLPATVGRVLSIMDGTCELPVRLEPCDGCGYLVQPGVYFYADTKRVGWHLNVDQTQIVIHPKPTAVKTYSVRGLKKRDTTLYDVANDVRTWRLIPLPTELHPVYFKVLYGVSLLEENPAKGKTWMNLAADELGSWLGARKSGGAPIPGTVRFLGKRHRRNYAY